MFRCFGLSSPLLDEDLGPEGTNYTSSMVHTWHHSNQTVNITYTLKANTIIRHVNLYFYSVPTMGIGLPTVTVLRSSRNSFMPVEYYITGNGNINHKDSMRRNVLLSLTPAQTVRFYRIQFDFTNTDVEWLVLSETQLCTSPTAVTAPSMPPSLLPKHCPHDTECRQPQPQPDSLLHCDGGGQV